MNNFKSDKITSEPNNKRHIHILERHMIYKPIIFNAITIYLDKQNPYMITLVSVVCCFIAIKSIFKEVSYKKAYETFRQEGVLIKQILGRLFLILLGIAMCYFYYITYFTDYQTGECGAFCLNSEYFENVISTSSLTVGLFIITASLLSFNTKPDHSLTLSKE